MATNGLVSSNRAVYQRRVDKEFSEHRRRVDTARPVVDASYPASRDMRHMRHNYKRELSDKHKRRLVEIDNEFMVRSAGPGSAPRSAPHAGFAGGLRRRVDADALLASTTLTSRASRSLSRAAQVERLDHIARSNPLRRWHNAA